MCDAEYLSLYRFTLSEVRAAIQRAGLGYKDESRQFLNFVTNARIVRIISSHEYTLPEPNWSLLQWELGNLAQACHPEPGDKISGVVGLDRPECQLEEPQTPAVGNAITHVTSGQFPSGISNKQQTQLIVK